MTLRLTCLKSNDMFLARDEASLVLLVETVVDWDVVSVGEGNKGFEVGDGVAVGDGGGDQGI